MAKEIGENQIHKMTITMPYDLSGQTLEAHYVDRSDRSTTAGGTASGDVEDNDVTITTDLAANGVEPGHYELEVHYDDGGTDRQLRVDGETNIQVLDAESVS